MAAMNRVVVSAIRCRTSRFPCSLLLSVNCYQDFFMSTEFSVNVLLENIPLRREGVEMHSSLALIADAGCHRTHRDSRIAVVRKIRQSRITAR